MPTDIPTYVKDIRGFGGGDPVSFQVATAVTDLCQGEFVAWASGTKVLQRFVRDSSAGKIVGISRDSQVGVAKLGNQPALARSVTSFSVFTTGIHQMVGTAAEVYGHGDSVFMFGTNTQQITKVSAGGTQVGTVHLPDGTTLTGAVKVPFLIDEFTKTQA